MPPRTIPHPYLRRLGARVRQLREAKGWNQERFAAEAGGQTVTTSFWNYGWALTPKASTTDVRTCMIVNGNVSVAIDSGPLIPVTYGGVRTDIAGFFPGFSNGAAAGGAYYVDITTLANGTHSIGWFVVDNCGRADGIGSRFFTVAKSSLAAAVVAPPVAQDLGPVTQADGGGMLVDPAPASVAVRRMTGDWTEVSRSAGGPYIVAVEQSERIEVRLPVLDDATYSGAHMVNGDRRALPLGSSFDTQHGIFYWQPGAGFLGSFDLVFTSGGAETKVRVVVGPSMRLAIDMPSSGGMVQQPFTVAGWALDLAATEGAGIDTVHVWAYPAAGGDPIFLGVADSGDVRPDVAATYGEQFGRSSFSVTATGLAPGTYDVVVYAHRVSTDTFEGAQSISVTVP